MTSFDYILVGGGLQNGLLALALRARQPNASVAVLEREDHLGGNHTWCFHDGDVPQTSRPWLDPLVAHSWPGYRVVFPRREHVVDQSYAAVTTTRFDEVVTASLHAHASSRLMLSATVVDVGHDSVQIEGGGEVRGTVVIDSRGPRRAEASAPAGYQKFLGLELELEQPHGLELPILMDATVDQEAGYRFMYVLPLDERRVLVEDTYFHDTPQLDADVVRAAILAYADGNSWRVRRVQREETGVLPMPWASSYPFPSKSPLAAGYRGGWFHPGTGYSFPVAVRLAEFVASRPPGELFGPELDRFALRHLRQVRFAQFLNRMLFRWYPPSARRSIFERFYTLPASTIGNFYALRLEGRDASRLLLGRPPRGLSLHHRLRRAAV